MDMPNLILMERTAQLVYLPLRYRRNVLPSSKRALQSNVIHICPGSAVHALARSLHDLRLAHSICTYILPDIWCPHSRLFICPGSCIGQCIDVQFLPCPKVARYRNLNINTLSIVRSVGVVFVSDLDEAGVGEAGQYAEGSAVFWIIPTDPPS